MGYKILKDDYYIQDTVLPGNIPGRQRYGLRYDPQTGDYVLSQKSAAGYTIGIGLAVLYKNGSWTSDAIQDSKLFLNNDPNKPTALAQQLSVDMRKKVYAAYKSVGGQAGGNKVNGTATPNQFNNPAGVNNFFPGTNPGIATAVPGGTILAAPPGSPNSLNQLFTKPLSEYGSVNEDKLFGSVEVSKERLLVYPLDILENRQDTLRITQYNYKAPLGDTLFNSKPGDILGGGLQRLSAAIFGEKEFRGSVILPMPNNAEDMNETNWGAAEMNNLTAAAAAQVVQNIGGSALGTLVAKGVQAYTGFNATPAIMYAKLLADITNNGQINNPDVQKMITSAVSSQILKAGSFEMSPEEILARGFGVVPNSNMELLFNKPVLRSFSFGYRLSPRSAREAKNVRRIIRFFKQGMAARKKKGKAGESAIFLQTPNVFKLQYRTSDDKPIAGVNRFKLCALTGFKVNYTPDGQWAAYDEGQPVSVTIGLSFTELEPVYENDYQEDILDELKDAPDLDPIGPDDVGY